QRRHAHLPHHRHRHSVGGDPGVPGHLGCCVHRLQGGGGDHHVGMEQHHPADLHAGEVVHHHVPYSWLLGTVACCAYGLGRHWPGYQLCVEQHHQADLGYDLERHR